MTASDIINFFIVFENMLVNLVLIGGRRINWERFYSYEQLRKKPEKRTHNSL